METEIKARPPVDLHKEIADLRTDLAYSIANPPRPKPTKKEQVVSFLVPILAVLSVFLITGLGVVYISAESRARCQAAFNTKFQQQTSVRVSLAAPENDARDVIFTAIGNYVQAPSEAGLEAVNSAISDYELIRTTQDQLRADNPVDAPIDICN